MAYYIYIDDPYILGISTSNSESGGNCTEEEYFAVYNAFRNPPTPQVGYGYRLKTDLTWEEYELPIEPDPDPDPDPESGSEEDMQMALEVLGVKP